MVIKTYPLHQFPVDPFSIEEKKIIKINSRLYASFWTEIN